MITANCKADTCNTLKVSEECTECKLIKEDETKETNKLRQLLLDQKEARDAKYRKLVGGTI
jgi:hypothetical protein